MTNAELIAKIGAEIERLTDELELQARENAEANNGEATDYCFGVVDMQMNLLSFLSALESEKPIPNDLEEASSKFATHTASNGVSVEFLEEKLSFQEGAKWQKEQDEILKVNYEGARTVYDNTVQHLQEKIDEKYELGKKDMKEQMMKKAVDGKVRNIIIHENGDEVHYSITYPKGKSQHSINDKVKIIIL